MGYSYSSSRYTINGLMDTSNSVLDNISTLCNACGAWLTYDNYAGKWSVIINRTGTSSYSFDDSNIIGPINISGTGLDSLYNAVKVAYPHEDLRNQRDYIQIEIPAEDRFPNEPDNVLDIDYKVVTNPVQAQMLGLMELKQSRVDKIINFVTDFSQLGIKAGDLIDITNSIYGFEAKMFRVITVKEVDNADNSIQLEITALEYDANVYDTSDLARYTVSTQNGIVAIGSIPAPTTPTVTAYTLVSNPRVRATTTVEGGIVEAVEFWYTTDVPPAVNDENNRTYQLLGTVKPQTAALFAAGETVTLEVPSLSAGQFLVKARCVNSTTSSPYSAPSGVLTYNAQQMTDAISDNTSVVDSNGDSVDLATMGGLAALLAIANSFFGGNAAVGPGGGSGSGSTFLLLDLENFNSNATTGGSTLGTGSYFVPVVRIVPPDVPSIIEGIDQESLSQCLVGAFRQSSSGFVSTGRDNFSWHAAWPQYYPHKILQHLGGTTQNYPAYFVNGCSHTFYGVDLNTYRYYYPTATQLQVEIRGYWRLYDQQTFVTNSSNVAPSDYAFSPTSVGTAPIHANAYVYTDAVLDRHEVEGPNAIVFYPGSTFATRGIGASANVTVSDFVYPESTIGSNNPSISKGDHIATFTYDFTKSALKAPSISSTPSFFSSIKETIDIPTTWDINKTGNVIANVTPVANVTVSCRAPMPGNIEVISGSWTLGSRTWNKRSIVSNIPQGGLVSPRITNVPFSANVFSYQYMHDTSMDYNGNPPWSVNAANTDGVSEWHNIYYPENNNLVTSGYHDLDTIGETDNLYKVQTTSVVPVAIDPFNKKMDPLDEYVAVNWGQIHSNVGNITVNNINRSYGEYGYVASSQYRELLTGGVAILPEGLVSAELYSYGMFYSNSAVIINHLAIDGNINANVNADNHLGYWVKRTLPL